MNESNVPDNRAFLARLLKGKANRPKYFPLSFGQQRLWLIHQLDSASPLYNTIARVQLRGELDLCVLRKAFTEITCRHESLRTTFVEINGEPMQVVHPAKEFDFQLVDLVDLPADQREAEAQRVIVESSQVPFDLAAGPLLRVCLLRLEESVHFLLLTTHHIVSDLWSLEVLAREAGILYHAFSKGLASPLAELPIQYADFSRWQRERLSGEVLEEHLEYWRERLSGELPLLELPTDRPRPAVRNNLGAAYRIVLPETLSDELRALSCDEGVTLFMTLLAAFKTLLYRYTGQPDIIVGTPIAGRDRIETEGLIGFFVNTVVMRSDLSDNPSFRAFLRRIKEVTLGAHAHQEMPFDRLVDELHVDRSFSHTPVFQVMFNVYTSPRRYESGKKKLRDWGELESAIHTAKFDLTMNMTDTGECITGSIEYSTELFDETTIRRMVAHFQNLLQGICANPETRLDDLTLLSAAERHQQLFAYNQTAYSDPALDLCLHELFEAQVLSSPDAIALVFDQQEISYRELNSRANQLAHHLQSVGVREESLVGILVERSVEMLVGVLGVLKAGAAYLPLDPTYPQERLSFMIEDADVAVLLTQQHLIERLASASFEVRSFTTLCLDRDWPQIAEHATENPARHSVAANAAYVIYTSGSTGKPKGVVVTHAGVVNFAHGQGSALDVQSGTRVLQCASLSFDISVWEIFGTLLCGATLCVPKPETHLAGDALHELLQQQAIEVVILPPTVLATLESEGLPCLRTVMSGGEACTAELATRWSTGRRFINAYGPTEITVCATMSEPLDGERLPPIGRPLANVQAYVLDQYMEPVAVGVAGELYVGGAGVTRGYLRRPELTAEKFVPHPYSERAGARLYRTGDVVRQRADGELEYLGRIDDQVKIRGFRIELGEIANALREQAGVRECVVLALGENGEEKRIVAYVVADEGVNARELRGELKQRLPEYMIPAAIVMLDEMPLTRNGKVDGQALPAPEEVWTEGAGNFVAPRTAVEEVLAGIWSDVLRTTRIGVNDNFFELGGHSLLATKVVSRIRKVFGVEIPVRAIFEIQTIATQAAKVEQLMYQGGALQAAPVVRTSREIELPLSFAQQRLWFIDRLTPESPLYNMPMAVRLHGALNLSALVRTFREIVRRHEVLRTNIVAVEGKPVQVIRPEAQADEIYLSLVDLSTLLEDLREAEMRRLAHAEAVRPFNLETDALMRTTVLRLDDQQHIALLTFHHIIFDGWSMGVFVREVAALYNAFSQGLESPLAELPVQYADYAVWQREWLQGEVLEQQIGYWKQQLEGAPELLELPTDRPRPAVQTHRGATVGMVLSPELTAQLRELCRAEGATLFMVLLAVFKVLLSRYTGQEDISVGTPIAGRNRVETEGLIGFFVNTLVLRTDLSGKPTMRELIRRVREVALGAYAHQELPFEKLVDELQVERSLSYMPLFQVVFQLQNAGQDVLELPGLSLGAVGETSGIAKFDLMLTMSESGEAISGALAYNTDLFDETTVTRMLMHFQMLLESISANPNQLVAALPMLADSERQLILHDWNDTERTFPADLCVHQLFEGQVLAAPDSIALICDEIQLSYRELNQRANQLAHHLRGLGVGRESPVALLMERNVDLIVSLLAILKAGGWYLPLDPDYPQERLSFMLRDANVRVVLTQSHLVERLPEHEARVVLVDAAWPVIEHESAENLTVSAQAESVAYVIYTSGSTGEPKGVEVTHRNIARLLFGVDYVDLEDCPRILQMASISFDASTFEVWGALLHGGCCVLYPERVPNYEGIGSCIARHQIDVMFITTALFNAVIDEAPQALSGVRQLLVGGEALSVEHIRRAQKTLTGVELTNIYGPTESTTFACHHRIEELKGDETGIAIGQAIGNTQAYIFDSEMEVVGVGIKGELYLGGEGIARGYLKRSGLTAERFVPNPYSKRGGERLYRTGDVCRYRKDGAIEYVGRIDDQVKVRGFRIELGEIETVLAKAEGIAEAVVVVREQAGEKRLVAYVVGEKGRELSASEMRKYLAQRLPDYMIPGAFVVLEEMPITANGKVDKKRLPEPTNKRPQIASEYVKPQTETEQIIAAVWQEFLQLSKVGTGDNFFELGGNSLLLVQVHVRLQKIFGEQVKVLHLFEHPTIRSLAAHLSHGEPSLEEKAEQEAANFEQRMTGKERLHQRLDQHKRVA